MKKIPKGQALELVDKLEAAGLNRELAQMIIGAPNNELSKAIMKTIFDYQAGNKNGKAAPSPDLSSNFQKISEFKVIVPEYSLKDYVKLFGDKYEFLALDEFGLDDKNFRPSLPLIPQETKIAEVYRLTKTTKFVDCLAFATKKGQLPNAQGIATIWHNNPEAIPNDYYLLGLDNPENLYKDVTEKRQMAIIGKNSSKLIFDTIPVSAMLPLGFCVAVFN